MLSSEKWQTQSYLHMISIKQSLLLLTLFNWVFLELQLICRNFSSFSASWDSEWFYIKPIFTVEKTLKSTYPQKPKVQNTIS